VTTDPDDRVRYVLRPGYGALTDDVLWGRLLDFASTTGMDSAAVFNLGRREAAQPERADITRRLELFARRFADLRALGISAQVNYFCTLGHWPQLTSELGRSFTPFTDAHGTTFEGCPCPLDPEFVAYITWCYAQFAALEVEAVWIDDDFRPGGRGSRLDLGCFCTRHLAAFNQRAGTELRADEIVSVLCRPPGRCSADDQRLRLTWRAVSQAALTGLARAIRDACVAANPTVAMGLMTNDATAVLHFARDLDAEVAALTTSDGRGPLVRYGGAAYTDERPLDLLTATHGFDVLAALITRPHRPASEIEQFSWTVGAKSARALRLEMATLTATIGGDHTLSTNDPRLGLDDLAGTYRATLGPFKAFLTALRGETAGLRRAGVSQPLTADPAVNLRYDLTTSRSLRRNVALGEIGIPLAPGDPAVVVVALEDVDAHDDGTVEDWAARGAIFSSAAYHRARVERGLLADCPIEVEPVEPLPHAYFASERVTTERAPSWLRGRDAITYSWRPIDIGFTLTARDGAEAWSELRDNLDRPRTAAVVVANNGGYRLAVTVHTGADLKDNARQWLYQELVTELGAGAAGATVALVPAIYPVWWHGADRALLCLSNFGLEDFPELTVDLPGATDVHAIERLGADGAWIPSTARVEDAARGSRLVLHGADVPQHLEFAAFRMKARPPHASTPEENA
jgi:hypothetical protein